MSSINYDISRMSKTDLEREVHRLKEQSEVQQSRITWQEQFAPKFLPQTVLTEEVAQEILRQYPQENVTGFSTEHAGMVEFIIVAQYGGGIGIGHFPPMLYSGTFEDLQRESRMMIEALGNRAPLPGEIRRVGLIPVDDVTLAQSVLLIAPYYQNHDMDAQKLKALIDEVFQSHIAPRIKADQIDEVKRNFRNMLKETFKKLPEQSKRGAKIERSLPPGRIPKK